MIRLATIVERAAATRWGGLRIDLTIACLFFLPLLFLWSWNALSKRGDHVLAFKPRLVLIPAGLCVAVVEADGRWWQAFALVALAVMCSYTVVLHLRSRSVRSEVGVRYDRKPRPTGWRAAVRANGGVVCILFAISLVFADVNPEGVRCGSISEALSQTSTSKCPGEARMHIAGIGTMVLGAGFLLGAFIWRRGSGGGREEGEPSPLPEAPTRPRRREQLRAPGH